MDKAETPRSTVPTSADASEHADLLRAIADGLTDDVAGRTMDTRTVKASLENELGCIAWA